MSELSLAYNLKGEPFEAPATMAAWRVYKIKKAGAPDIVYGLDGLPLFLPMDADTEDLRYQVRGETGKFRLEPVDEHNKSIANAPAGYVFVHPLPPAAAAPTAPIAPATPTAPAAGQADITAALVAALLESQKQHTELARMYVSQFPVVANAMAGVVRSASDAGLTTRVPLVLPVAPQAKPDDAAQRDTESDDEQSDDSDDQSDEMGDEINDDTDGEQLAADVAPPREYSWARVAQTLADHAAPHVGPLLAGLPGLAAMLGAKRAPAAIDAQGPDPQGPAPAEAEASASSGPMAGLTAGMMVRINAILAQLTPVEQQFARVLLEEIPADELPTWFERLRAMSVDEAVGYVRERFREGQAAANTRPAEPTAPRSAPPPAPPTAPIAPIAPAATSREVRRSSAAAATTAQRPIRRTAPSNGLALLDEGTQAHLAAIDAALTHDEAAALRKQFAALAPRERASWVATLVTLPVADAVAAIRAQLAATDHSVVAPEADAPKAEDAATSPAPQDSPVAATAVPSNATAPAPRAGARSAGAIAPASGDASEASTDAADSPALRTVPAASTIEIAAAPAVPAAVPIARDADSHLAEVERGLTAEERVRMNAMFSRLSPDEREAWLDRLLSAPPSHGTAMLRAVLGAQPAGPRLAPLQIAGAPVTAATASTASGTAAAIPSTTDGADPDDPVVDQIELKDADALDDATEPEDTVAPANPADLDTADLDTAELGDTAELDDTTELEDTAELGADVEPAAVNQPHTDPAADRSATPHDPIRAHTAGDTRHVAEPARSQRSTDAGLPTSNTDVNQHFRAIEAQLTLAERMRAHELAAQRPAAELARWYADLLCLSAPDAVTKIRAELARSDGAQPTTQPTTPPTNPPTTKKGGAS